MPRVNYIVECREFQKFAVKNRLTANEFMLWHALLELFNREAKGAWWPDEYLSLANSVVLAQTSFGAGDSACDILFRARKGLVRHGLIRYRKGKRNALMPQYAMNYFSAEKDENLIESRTENAPAAFDNLDKTELDAGKTPTSETPKKQGRPQAKALKNPINPNTDSKPITSHTLPAGGSSETGQVNSVNLLEILREKPDRLLFDSAWQTSAKARGAVAQRLLYSYEGVVDSTDAWDSLCEVMRKGLPPDAILRVMPFRPVFSQLSASLQALCHVSAHGSGQTAALIKQFKNNLD